MPALEQANSLSDSIFDLTRLTNLTELRLGLTQNTNAEIVAMNLSRLERLVVCCADTNVIRPFLRHSKHLKTIRVNVWKFGDVFDLFTMNQEREKLGSTRQVLLYSPEAVYLSTKFKFNYFNSDLVKITRMDRIDINFVNLCHHQ